MGAGFWPTLVATAVGAGIGAAIVLAGTLIVVKRQHRWQVEDTERAWDRQQKERERGLINRVRVAAVLRDVVRDALHPQIAGPLPFWITVRSAEPTFYELLLCIPDSDRAAWRALWSKLDAAVGDGWATRKCAEGLMALAQQTIDDTQRKWDEVHPPEES